MQDIEFLFHTDVAELADAINKMPLDKWNEFTLRQRLFKAQHGHTLTIPFKWSLLSDYLERDQNQTKLFDATYNYTQFPVEFLDAITKISKGLTDYWQNKNVLNCILIKLLAGKKIPLHEDGGMLRYVRRCHLAVITHPDVTFTVGKTSVHMAAGDWYLIDNTALHAVDNNSPIDRVHLVIDVGN